MLDEALPPRANRGLGPGQTRGGLLVGYALGGPQYQSGTGTSDDHTKKVKLIGPKRNQCPRLSTES